MQPSSPRVSRARIITAVVVLTLCLALLGTLGYRLAQGEGGGSSPLRINSAGSEVPVKPYAATDFELESYEGGTMKLSDLRGKVVVVNFWSSWCPPCKDEAPEFQAVHQAYEDKNVVVLGVNVWDKDKDAKGFLLEQGITYRNGVPKGAGLAAEYGLSGIPETFIVNPDGMVVKRWNGPLTQTELSDLIAPALTAAENSPQSTQRSPRD